MKAKQWERKWTIRKFPLLTLIALASLVPRRVDALQTAARSASQGTLEVTVVDEEGKKLPGVLVAVPAQRSTTTAAGTCRFNLLPGRYSILVSKDGYRGRRIYVGIRPGETTTTRVKLQKLPAGLQPTK